MSEGIKDDKGYFNGILVGINDNLTNIREEVTAVRDTQTLNHTETIEKFGDLPCEVMEEKYNTMCTKVGEADAAAHGAAASAQEIFKETRPIVTAFNKKEINKVDNKKEKRRMRVELKILIISGVLLGVYQFGLEVMKHFLTK